MRLLLLLAALAGAPRPAIHFHLDGQQLLRREVTFTGGGLQVLRTDLIRLPGLCSPTRRQAVRSVLFAR